MKLLLSILPLLLLVLGCTSSSQEENVKVKTGAEIMLTHHLDIIGNRKVGLVINKTAVVGQTHLLDTLLSSGVNITALFAPEHGIRGDVGAGEEIMDGIDQKTKLPVYSLYGANKGPTTEMLKEVDLLIFDMQDVGARFYTYNATMKFVIESAFRNGKEVWILDRPNPAGGDYVAGWILEDEFKSFVGEYPIPIAHGLTLGELAIMSVREGWIDVDSSMIENLLVIEMEGWERNMKWYDTGLEWIPPSPNLPTFEHAYVYLGTCLIEGTTLSEGRGTENPFLTLGSPSTVISDSLMKNLETKFGVEIQKIEFTPRSIPGKAPAPKLQDQLSKGIYITAFKNGKTTLEDPVKLGYTLVHELLKASTGTEMNAFMYKLAGTEEINSANLSGWGEDFESYLEKRKAYLLYD